MVLKRLTLDRKKWKCKSSCFAFCFKDKIHREEVIIIEEAVKNVNELINELEDPY